MPEKFLKSNFQTTNGIGKNQENLSCILDDLTAGSVMRRPSGLRCSHGQNWLVGPFSPPAADVNRIGPA